MIAQISNLKSQSQNANGKAALQDKAYAVAVRVVRAVNALELEPRNYALTNQVLRSGTSIAANIFEARSASSKKDWLKFYEIALKSANETIFWLRLLADAGLVTEKRLGALQSEVNEVARMLAASVLTGKGKRQP
jgi:four helix bundle protein